MNSRQQGFSLLELTVAMVILGMVMLLAMVFSQRMTDSTALEEQMNDLRQVGDKAGDLVIERTRPGLIPAYNVAGDNTLTFLEPVDFDGDNDTLNNAMVIEWGCTRPNAAGVITSFLDKSWSYNTTTLTWVQTVTDQTFTGTVRYVATGVFNEATRNYDLNQDGDTADVFSIGHLEWFYPKARVLTETWQPQYTEPITSDNIVQVQGNPRGDIDGNGVADPIFLVSGSYLQITLFLTKPNEARPMLVKVTKGGEMRNMM